MKRVSASLVLVMLTSCLPLPGGTTVSRQQVAGKSGEDLLVARSGDTCQVSSVVHERISIGDTHVCA